MYLNRYLVGVSDLCIIANAVTLRHDTNALSIKPFLTKDALVLGDQRRAVLPSLERPWSIEVYVQVAVSVD